MRAACMVQCRLQAIIEQFAVGQVRERIVLGDVAQPGFGLLAFDGGGDLG